MAKNIKITGLKEVIKELSIDAVSDIHAGVRRVIIKTALKVDDAAKRSLQGGHKTGRLYQKTQPRRLHRASAKGEAPASDTANLVNSIRVKESIGLKATVSANAKYAGILEEDLERPFMEPAYEDSEAFLERELNKVIDRALR